MSGLGFTHWGALVTIAFGVSFCTIDYANAKVTASTFGQGNAGNITINSGSFLLQDGAQLTAVTFGQGNAGTIKVNAAEEVTISNSSSNINSDLLVNSQSPTGTAKDIIVTSPIVTLDNSSGLNAESSSGNGANISLQVQDLLLLRRESLVPISSGGNISTNSTDVISMGNGGNIFINAPAGFIIAKPVPEPTWKLSFADDGHEFIVRMGMKGEKVNLDMD